MTMRSFQIGIFAYAGAQLAAIHGLADLFLVANGRARSRTGADAAQITVRHFIEAGENTIEEQPPPGRSSPVQPLHALILPSSLEDQAEGGGSAFRQSWLKHLHGEGTLLASVCSGAFVLAETGLLSGRRVTTHWASRARMESLFPDILVDADKLLIDGGDIVTAGGLMAWTDLGLLLVERYLGHAIMLDTARYLLIDPPGREQRSYQTFVPPLLHGDEAILKVQHWLQKAHAGPASVSIMAGMAGLEERTFLRRFRQATRLRPNEYLQQLRISEARALLETTRLAIDAVARSVGYEDPNAFRKLFVRMTGLKPGEYRQRFGRSAGA